MYSLTTAWHLSRPELPRSRRKWSARFVAAALHREPRCVEDVVVVLVDELVDAVDEDEVELDELEDVVVVELVEVDVVVVVYVELELDVEVVVVAVVVVVVVVEVVVLRLHFL